MSLRQNRSRPSMAGYSLIEVLISLAVLSIGIVAITVAVMSASGTSRITTRADMGIMWGQEVMEQLAGMPLGGSGLEVGSRTILTDAGRIEIEVMDPVDVNNDGRDDFKTIAMRVFVERGGTEELRMENFLRRAATNH